MASHVITLYINTDVLENKYAPKRLFRKNDDQQLGFVMMGMFTPNPTNRWTMSTPKR